MLTVRHGNDVVEITEPDLVVAKPGDMLDLMANAHANAIILRREQFAPEFFDLKTGLAGEILQKFSTYDKRLAIVGDFSEVTSKALRDLIFECNKIGRTIFVPTVQAALEIFGSQL